MKYEKKGFLIFLIIFSWSLPIISTLIFKITGYLEPWHYLIFFFLSFLSFLIEFKIGRGRIGIEPLFLLPIAIIFKSPFAIAITAFTGAFLGSYIIKKRERGFLSKIAFSSTFIFPYSLSAIIAHTTSLSIFYLLFISLITLFLSYFFLFVLFFIVHKKPFDSNFLITIFAWFIAFLSFSPLIYLEITLYYNYGILGIVFPLFPLGLIAYALKKSAEDVLEKREKLKQKEELKFIKSYLEGIMEREEKEVVFSQFLKELQNLLPFSNASLIFWETERGQDFEIYTFGEGTVEKDELEKGLKKFNFPMKIPSYELLEAFKNTYPLNKEKNFSTILPIKTPQLYLGLFYLSGNEEEIEKEEAKEYLNLLCDTIGISYHNKILLERMEEAKGKLEKNSEILSTLLNVSHQIIVELDSQSALQGIVKALNKILNIKWILFCNYLKEEKIFVPKGHFGFEKIWERIKDEKIPEEEIFLLWKNSEIVSKSYILEPKNYVKERYGVDFNLSFSHPLTSIFVPLKIQDELLGFLSVEGFDMAFMEDEKIRLLELFANQASYLLNIIKIHEKLHTLSIKDTLTEAYNLRYLKEVLPKEITKHKRLNTSFGFSILDLDNFKEINDKYGHLIGDMVLQELVSLIISYIRKELDMIFRYGGDEFALFFPFLGAEKIKNILERIRMIVQEYNFKFKAEGKDLNLKISITMGASIFPRHGNDLKEIIEKADKALLLAKAKGKNTVAIYNG